MGSAQAPPRKCHPPPPPTSDLLTSPASSPGLGGGSSDGGLPPADRDQAKAPPTDTSPPGVPQLRICEQPELSWVASPAKLLTRGLLWGCGCGWTRGRAGVRAQAFLWRKRPVRSCRDFPTAPPWGQPEPLAHIGQDGPSTSRPATQLLLQSGYTDSTPTPLGKVPPQAKVTAFTLPGPVVLGQSTPTLGASQSSFPGLG